MSDASPAPLPVRTGSLFYELSADLVRLLVFLFTKPTIVGLKGFPTEGGLLVVSNHLSIADPVLLAVMAPRPLIFMAKQELFQRWYQRWALRRWGVFPVRRGEADRSAVRGALAVLQAGQALVLFPEGTRRPQGLGEGRAGVAYLAARSGCPILPVAFVGTEAIRGLGSLRHRPSFQMIVGEPFRIEDRRSGRASDLIMEEIARLLPPERRGRYGAPAPVEVRHA